MKINQKALALSLGVTCGASIFLIGLTGPMMSNDLVSLIGSFYLGFNSTLLGSLLGFVYGFVDGFIGGYVIAWLYNKFQKK